VNFTLHPLISVLIVSSRQFSMASNDPGLAPFTATAEDPTKDAIYDSTGAETDRPVALDQFDEKFEATKWEIWAYYA
jgi:hypothetical protein